MNKSPQPIKPRHIPMRTCAGCRAKQPKSEMIRIVRTPEGEIKVDGPKGKISGRGTYLCADVVCFEQALKRNAISHVLKVKISEEQMNSVKDGFVARLMEQQQLS